MNQGWTLQRKGRDLMLRCPHPRPVRRCISQLRLRWPDGEERVLNREASRRGSAWSGPLQAPSRPGWRLEAHLDLEAELQSLLRLPPGPGQLGGWLERQRQRRRWRGLALAAGSGDPSLTVAPAVAERLLPLLLRHALLDPGHGAGLAVLMGLCPQGWRLHGWLQCLQGADAQQLPLLQLAGLAAVGRQERLLALERLSQQSAGSPWAHTDTTAAASTIPLLQYWEGQPVPADVEAMLAAWRQQLPELEVLRLDAAAAHTWISRHGDPGDGERLARCWHPAMQSDFLRVLRVARQGGVYLDCDTPTPADGAALERWRQLLRHCWSSNTLALCVNAVRQPGDIRYYAVNCCLWAPPQHPLMQRWLAAYRQRLDSLPAELVGTPQGIHRLGPELVSELIDDLIRKPECRLEPIHWQGVTLPRLRCQHWRVLLLNNSAYRQLFGVPFSCHASYQSCNDPRDWKVGVRP